jgi:2-(1,2-epoxy-1,2-dihydrophenyl)acetyl-CoA isomerase
MTTDVIRYRVTNNVAWVVLDQPKTMNAFDAELAAALDGAIEKAADDDAVRAMVITGEGRAFCAGGDVVGFQDRMEHVTDYVDEIIGHLHGAIRRINELPFPVIAGINGTAAGAGLSLMLATDLAVATESAMFVMGYSGIGATPDGSSTFFLPRIVGTRRALELTLTNRPINTTEALDWGLLNKVLPDDEFAAGLTAYAEKLAAGPTKAYAAARRLIRDSHHTTLPVQLGNEHAAFRENTANADFREGVAAFAEKRKPIFKGV